MIFGKKDKWLWLILLYLITFAWDDDVNPPESIRGYRLYIAGITCTEPILEETIDILDVMARQYTVTGCGSRNGWLGQDLKA